MREPKVNVMVPTQKVTGVQTPFVHSVGSHWAGKEIEAVCHGPNKKGSELPG